MKIVLSIVVVMFLISCGDEKASTPKSEKSSVVNKTVEEKKQEPQVEKKMVQEKEVVASKPLSGGELFKKCASCHGLQAQKKALGKSQVIQGWSSKKIITALDGYKSGTYGASMKGVMKSQVSQLNDAEIEVLAKYISKL